MSFNILVVDNEISTFESIEHSLLHHVQNIDINHARTTKESDIFIEEKIYHLIFVDLQLKHTDATAYITKLKNLYNTQLSIIISISQDFNENIINLSYEKGAIDFIQKPLNEHKLISSVKFHKTLFDKEKELKYEKDFAIGIMDSISSPIFLFANEKVTFANKAFLKIMDIQNLQELQNRCTNIENFLILPNGKKISSLQDKQWIKKYIETSILRAEVPDSTGKIRTYSVSINQLSEQTYVMNLYDLTQEIEHEKQLKSMLYQENLTKLPNRAKLIKDLQQEQNGINALAIIDINSFKEINDFYGHKIGDFILKGISDLINSFATKNPGVSLYKFPSDTYCLANQKLSKQNFTELVRQTIDTIDKKVFHFEQHEIDTRATAGVSFSTKSNKLITADLALQAAKKDHKDYLVFYDELDNLQEYQNNMLWTKKLKKALKKDKIVLYYQPLINNKTMMVDKYECLVRMIDDDKVISPFFFLDVSKKSNQYTKITKIVIAKSFKEFENLPFEFSVNISYEDIEDEGFLDYIKEQLCTYDVAQKVVFEILEDEGIKNYDVLIDFINEIKALGCKVAIDDFGSGYSNFEHLLKMNVDFLKIDASLIKNIATDENSYKVTKTIIEFANSLNLKTIAEFVENEKIFNIARNLGTDYSQGYYFSAPRAKPNMYSVN